MKSQLRCLTAELYAASYGAKNPVSHKFSLIRPRSCAPRDAFFYLLLLMTLYESLIARWAIADVLVSRYWGIQVLNGCTCMHFFPYFVAFSIKIYNQRLLSRVSIINVSEQRHKCILISTSKAPGVIKTGFEVAIEVFDSRIVRSILRG